MRLVLVVAAVVLVLLASACGDERSGRPVPSDTPTGSTEASPFVVENPPKGMTLKTAGAAETRQSWGDDTMGTDEPTTVLVPDGVSHPTADDAVVVSVTGFEGYQGGLNQASRCYTADEKEFEVDGRSAIYCAPLADPPADQPWRARGDLVVVRGDDLAVRVAAPANWEREAMVRVARATTPADDHALAPHVEPPAGWHVFNHTDVDGLPGNCCDQSSLGTTPEAGPHRRFSIVWWGPTTNDWMAAVSVRGTAMSDAQLAPSKTASSSDSSPVVTTRLSNGDHVVVYGYGAGADPELRAAVARSARPATDEEWEGLRAQISSQGLRPDPGRHELARGTSNGVEWLWQDRRADQPAPVTLGGGPGYPTTGNTADTCLTTAADLTCATVSGAFSDLVYWSSRDAEVSTAPATTAAGTSQPMVGPFLIVVTDKPASGVHVTGPGIDAQAQLLPVPGETTRRAAIVFTDSPVSGVLSRCASPNPPPGGSTIELTDPDGRPMPCS
ncbi:MAG TPA: hypothetical protein VJM33_05685 [Microthrixaceae bacterium]|nr:hypothetical protein [Microthrixaceae bacterium]